jgi:hypothetical protein
VDRPIYGLSVRGAHVRGELERRTSAVFGQVVRQAIEAVLSVVSLADLVRRHVDLDALARDFDVRAWSTAWTSTRWPRSWTWTR